MNIVKFLALGGMDEDGKNLFAIEIDNSIFIMDAGNKNPAFHSFGIDMIIPDFSYLETNKDRIKGIFISNGHSYNIGALSYIVKAIPTINIYSTPITKSTIENEFRKMRVSKFNLKIIEPNDEIKIQDFTIKSFQLTSEQPESVGFAIVKGGEQVVYAVDYVIDINAKNVVYQTNLLRIKDVAKSNKTRLLITDALNSRQKGEGRHGNTGYINGFKEALKTEDQILLVGAFNDNLKAIQEMIHYAVEQNKKIIIYDRTLNEQIKTLKSQNLINLPNKLLISFKKLTNERNCVIFASQSFYQLYRKLSNIANKEDEYIKLNNKFDVFIAAIPIPGAETFYYKIIDQFYKAGIRASSVNKLFAKGSHPFQEDIIWMIKMFTPENLIPIKGYFRDFIALETLAKENGIKNNGTILLDNGEICEITKDGIKLQKKKIKCVEKFVDGLGVGDVGHTIIHERNIMGNGGTIFVGILINERTKQLLQKPKIEAIGFTDNPELLNILTQKVDDLMEEFLPANEKDTKNFNMRETKNTIRKKILNFCRRKMNKEPAIIPVIIELR